MQNIQQPSVDRGVHVRVLFSYLLRDFRCRSLSCLLIGSENLVAGYLKLV